MFCALTYLVIGHSACITPSIKKKMLNNIFSASCLLTPSFRNVATGGKHSARMTSNN